ncbi:MAG: phosphoribosylglycinamide formyltransferase [Chitinophagales bacterium]
MQQSRNKIRIAIFASGSGTNAENCMQYFAQHSTIEIALIVTNNSEAGVIERAEKYNVPICIFEKATWKNPEIIITELQSQNIHWIVLAGYLKLIPEKLIEEFPQRIINIHPALLPKYGGRGMYGHKVHEAVFNNKEKESGITIHFVDEHYDNGDIIFQKSFPISETDTPESIEKKVRELEFAYLPEVIEKAVLN